MHDFPQRTKTRRLPLNPIFSLWPIPIGDLLAFTMNGADFCYSVLNPNVRAILNEMAHNATPSGQLRSVAPGWTFWAVEAWSMKSPTPPPSRRAARPR
jgi:isoquinoline 1-oxidoreductase beta subunit